METRLGALPELARTRQHRHALRPDRATAEIGPGVDPDRRVEGDGRGAFGEGRERALYKRGWLGSLGREARGEGDASVTPQGPDPSCGRCSSDSAPFQ